MRIAWLGPEPSLAGGVPYMATLLLQGLPRAGVEVDAYVATVDAPFRDALSGVEGLRVFEQRMAWDWDRWYSRQPLLALTSAQVARARAQRQAVRVLAEQHARAPYDAIYQFSQVEVPWLDRTAARTLPPVIVHPEVHAAGELRWTRRERALARRLEPAWSRWAAEGVLAGRAVVQRRHVARVDGVIAPSEVFGRQLRDDYGIPADRMRVVPNPIDVERFAPAPAAGAAGDGEPQTIVFVSRMAVRKGVEMVVGLSRRLADLAGSVRLLVIGDKSMFSDYRSLLSELDPSVAEYVGGLPADELAATVNRAAVLVQPSHYEPFALTVGEALACGVPVVVSDQVGASEGVDPRCCHVFAAGDLDAFEAGVRAALASRDGTREELRALARAEALRLFAPDAVCARLAGALEALAPRR